MALFEKVTSESVSSRLQSLVRDEAEAAMIVINGRQLAQIEWKRVWTVKEWANKRTSKRMRRGYVFAAIDKCTVSAALDDYGDRDREREAQFVGRPRWWTAEQTAHLHVLSICCPDSLCQRDWDAISAKHRRLTALTATVKVHDTIGEYWREYWSTKTSVDFDYHYCYVQSMRSSECTVGKTMPTSAEWVRQSKWKTIKGVLISRCNRLESRLLPFPAA